MPHTAWATIATAVVFNPVSMPSPTGPENSAAPYANATISTAEGSVNATNAANAPRVPARCSPSPKPTWLEAGPGRN